MMSINSLMINRTGALIRLSWFVIALLCLGVFILAIPARLDQLLTVTESADLSVGQLTPEDASLLVDQGLSLEFYASYFTLFEILVAVILIGLALALFMIKSNDPMALMVSIVFMSLSVSLPGATALIAQQPGLTLVVDILRAIAFWGVLVFFYTFPDGKFIPRWTKWIGIVWAIYIIGWMIYPPIKPPMSFGAQLSASQNSGLILILLLIVYSSGIIAQFIRYYQYSNPHQQQQTKWAVFSFGVFLFLTISGILTMTLPPLIDPSARSPLLLMIGATLILMGGIVIPSGLALSIVRYRLWDIDVIIRRTLIYAVLTGVLATIFFSSVVLLQSAFLAFLGRSDNPLVTVLSTLTIAALFNPLRIRVQTFIDRRFYRSKYNIEKTLANFAATSRDEVEIERLTQAMLGVLKETLKPEKVSLWLRKMPPPANQAQSNRGKESA